MKMAGQEQIKKTPLYVAHIAAGGKMTDFHGWLLPIQYGSILKEHENVRTGAGLFDVSHMGEIEVSGPDSTEYLQRMLTADISAKTGKASYSPMCYPDGGTVDDLIVYRKASSEYLLVVNASNTEKDFQWLIDNKKGRVNVEDRSAEYAQLAIQGPMAKDVLKKLTDANLDMIRKYHFIENLPIAGIEVLLSRTGYTGEDGFELYCRPGEAEKLWNILLDAGRENGLAPVGLGARDTLRMEAAMPLYGQELAADISPVEAGLERFIKTEKNDFVGRDALLLQLERRPEKKLAGFEMVDRAVPRTGYGVYLEDQKIGHVTSGGFFPTLKKNMGMAMIDAKYSKEGGTIWIKVRDSFYKAQIVRLPFYKRY